MGFLREIVAETRESIDRGDYRPDRTTRRGSPRSLAGAVRAAAPGALVVEYKRVSPGAPSPELGVGRPSEFVARVRDADVAALSCLATVPRFGGSPRDVAEVARSSPLPVLFKDFVIDPVQVDCARTVGASAVLLIARLADADGPSAPLSALADHAHRLGLEVLLEFHDRSELKRTSDVRADVYGVNVRDLDTLRMEPERAYETLRAAAELRPLLGLSGVREPEDARRLATAGADGLLVGTSVARASDPVAFLRSLRAAASGGRP